MASQQLKGTNHKSIMLKKNSKKIDTDVIHMKFYNRQKLI